jgi:hypothetical protein
MNILSQDFFRRGSGKEQKARKQTDFSTRTNRKYSFTGCYEKEILRFSKDKIKIEEKPYCLGLLGAPRLESVAGSSNKLFFFTGFGL